MKRKKIPKYVKDHVRNRQDGRCACCLERGAEFHHVMPVALGGDNFYTNIILLCKEHHNLLHLGDIQTCMAVLEYSYYIQNLELPSDISELELLYLEMRKRHEKNTQK